MSPHSAGTAGIFSADKEGTTSQRQPEDHGHSPSEEVDFIPVPHQAAQQQSTENGSVEIQRVLSTNNATLTSNDSTPQPRHDGRGGDDFFRFLPSPRHAPGHFTNRKIVARTDGSERDYQANRELNTNTVSKGNESGLKPRTPPREAPHNRPAVFPSFAVPPLTPLRMVDWHIKQPAQSKKIGLPFAKNQGHPASNAETETAPDITEQLTKWPIQAVQSRHTSHSPHQPAEPPALPTNLMASNDAGIGNPPTTKPQLVFTEVVSPVLEPGDVLGVSQQQWEVTMEPLQGEAPALSASLTSPHLLMALHQKPLMMSSPGSKKQSNPKQGLRDHQATRRQAPRGKDGTSSWSISSSSSAVSKRKHRSSTLDLNLFRDRELPEVANKMNNFYKLCNDAVMESQRKTDKYQKKLHSTSQKLANCLDALDVQGQSIEQFENENHDMHNRIHQLEQQVRAYSDKVPGLMAKCRTVEDMLNCALKEKQELFELYKRHKKDSEDAIQEIRTEKQHEQSLRELIDRQLTALREQMKAKIHQVEVQSQEESRCMKEKVQLLSQKIEETESQLSRERDTADQLSKQLGESRKVQSSLQDVQAQTSNIFKLLGERQKGDNIELVLAAQEESKAKLENTAEQLETLRDLLMPHCEATSTIAKKQDEAMSEIMSTLRTIHKAQSHSRETDDLKAQLAIKCSVISDLEAKLVAQNESYKAEVGSLTREISRFTRLMNERDEASRSTTEKAVATVQEECRSKLQRREDEMQGRLQQAQDGRNSAETELAGARKKLEDMETAEHDKSDQIKAFATANDEAMLRNQKLVEDLHGKEARLVTLTGAFQSIAEWASSKAAVHGLEFNVGRVWDDSEMDGDEGKRWTALLETLLEELGMHHASSQQAPSANIAASKTPVTTHSHAQAMFCVSEPLSPNPFTQDLRNSEENGETHDSELTQGLRTGSDHASRLRDSSRRATVQSPHPGVLTPIPPSVEQEKVQRRASTQQPKSIIKRPLTRSRANANDYILGREWELGTLSPDSKDNTKHPKAIDELQTSAQIPVPNENDEDIPPAKRARTKSGKVKSSSKSKQPAPRSGLAAPGVVHGRLLFEVAHGKQASASEPKNVS